MYGYHQLTQDGIRVALPETAAVGLTTALAPLGTHL